MRIYDPQGLEERLLVLAVLHAVGQLVSLTCIQSHKRNQTGWDIMARAKLKRSMADQISK